MSYPVTPSTATKRAVLRMMFKYAGQAGYEFDETPDEVTSALNDLDAMMAELSAQGININYNFPAVFGEGDPDDAFGCPDWAVNVISVKLALRYAPGIGKTLSREANVALARGESMLLTAATSIPAVYPARGTPRGSGSSWIRWPAWPYVHPTYSSDVVTLNELTLSDDQAFAGGIYQAVINGAAAGSQLAIITDPSGNYTLVGRVLTGESLSVGDDPITIRETYVGAPDNYRDTTLTVHVSA